MTEPDKNCVKELLEAQLKNYETLKSYKDVPSKNQEAKICLALGRYALGEKKEAEAKELFRKAETHFSEILMELEKGKDYNEASKNFREKYMRNAEAFKSHLNLNWHMVMSEIYRNVGTAQYYLGDYEKAHSNAEKSVQYEPISTEAWQLMSKSSEKRGNMRSSKNAATIANTIDDMDVKIQQTKFNELGNEGKLFLEKWKNVSRQKLFIEHDFASERLTATSEQLDTVLNHMESTRREKLENISWKYHTVLVKMLRAKMTALGRLNNQQSKFIETIDKLKSEQPSMGSLLYKINVGYEGLKEDAAKKENELGTYIDLVKEDEDTVIDGLQEKFSEAIGSDEKKFIESIGDEAAKMGYSRFAMTCYERSGADKKKSEAVIKEGNTAASQIIKENRGGMTSATAGKLKVPEMLNEKTKVDAFLKKFERGKRYKSDVINGYVSEVWGPDAEQVKKLLENPYSGAIRAFFDQSTEYDDDDVNLRLRVAFPGGDPPTLIEKLCDEFEVLEKIPEGKYKLKGENHDK